VVADAALWCAMVALLLIFRGTLLWLFRAEMAAESDAHQIARCFGTGLRFDIFIASYAILPTLLLTLIGFFWPLGPWHKRVRQVLAISFVAVSMLTFIVDVSYFREYHDQFNHWIFGLIFDDRNAIVQTIWKSYPVIRLTVLVISLTTALVWAGRRFWRACSGRIELPLFLAQGCGRWLTPLLLAALFFLGIRASVGLRPIQMKDAAVTRDPFLNKLVMNPYAAFRYAIKHQRMLTQTRGLRLVLPDGDVRAAAGAWFPAAGAVTDLDQLTQRATAGSPTKPAQHIFLVVLESYDAWGLRPECAALHATDRLAELGRAGIAADAFVSAADGTMPSLAALITGLPDTGVHVNFQPSVKKGVPTDTARIFKRLGYRTRFSYGGYLSWQRLGDFCREQGFDEVHGGAEMSERLTGNEWGVDDENLYDFVLNQLGEKPTFNMLMTTSYHPPFSVDLKAKGFPRDQIAPELAARGFSPEETRILGHLWYSDQALGNFVAATLKKFPNSLFAITGDHWSRRAFSSRPILFGQRAVPFVLYGPEVLRAVQRPEHIAGSHLDIVPTLIELSAPRGFIYHSFGRNLLDPAQPQIGYGNRTVLTPEVILDVLPEGQVQDMQGRSPPDRVRVAELRLRYQQLHALSWWRVMKGKDL
jgi:phosphoglycerol transferase MdoB-like AlkP superfamily enzyme